MNLNLIIAVFGVALASYFDLHNRRNIPSWICYALAIAAVLLSPSPAILAAAILMFAILQIFRENLKMGEADVYAFASLLALLGFLAFALVMMFSGASIALSKYLMKNKSKSVAFFPHLLVGLAVQMALML